MGQNEGKEWKRGPGLIHHTNRDFLTDEILFVQPQYAIQYLPPEVSVLFSFLFLFSIYMPIITLVYSQIYVVHFYLFLLLLTWIAITVICRKKLSFPGTFLNSSFLFISPEYFAFSLISSF